MIAIVLRYMQYFLQLQAYNMLQFAHMRSYRLVHRLHMRIAVQFQLPLELS